MAKAKKKVNKKKTTKKASEELSLINLKVSGKDRRKMQRLAQKFAGGNLSAWLRHAGSNYEPPENVVIR